MNSYLEQKPSISDPETFDPADYLGAVYFDSDGCKCGSNVVIQIEFTIEKQLYILNYNTTDSELVAMAGIIRGSILENVIVENLEQWLRSKRDLCIKNFDEQN